MARVRRRTLESVVAPRRPYPSDLTDEQWARWHPLLTKPPGPGQPTTVDLRDVVNTHLYMKQPGCQWRYLPHDLLPRSTVFYYFEKGTADGTLDALMGQLRERPRQQAGRARHPTAAILDRQTAKTAGPGLDVGWDGGK
jgi:transposase